MGLNALLQFYIDQGDISELRRKELEKRYGSADDFKPEETNINPKTQQALRISHTALMWLE